MARIVTKNEFNELRAELKSENKAIVLCHGVFDLVHPGHLIHFEDAKKQGDVLVVSVTMAKFVRKGIDRPYFDDDTRLYFLSSLAPIDYVMLSEGYTSDDIIEIVQPDIYVKGSEFAEINTDVTGQIAHEKALIESYGGRVYFSKGNVFSSSKLINLGLPSFSPELKKYLSDFSKHANFTKIKEVVERFRNLKVLVIGDVIFDEYIFCNVQGLMYKDTGYSTRHISSEMYFGGSLAVARHISEFCDNVTLMSVMGSENHLHSRILNSLSDRMKIVLECGNDYNTIVKKRYLTKNEKRDEFHKLFSCNNLPEKMYVNKDLLHRLHIKLEKVIDQYDGVVVCDFGHGLIDSVVMDIVQRKAKYLCVNCQTNSSNLGMNIITKYNRIDSFALDQRELQLAVGNNLLDDTTALQNFQKRFNAPGWLTRGSLGAYGIGKNGDIIDSPAFTLTVKDTIGAGDAFYAMSSLASIAETPIDISTFLSNAAGALAANIIGNEKPVEKVHLMKFASTLLNI